METEIERLRAALRWIQSESTSVLCAYPNTLTNYRYSMKAINVKAREALAPTPLAAIAADTNVDQHFRRILQTGQPLSAYGDERHDMTTDGRQLRSGE